jgi:prepilin-type N-terminal cleavage/methylation domain-containing protein
MYVQGYDEGTLVELLVVIAIIAILAAILFPVFAQTEPTRMAPLFVV